MLGKIDDHSPPDEVGERLFRNLATAERGNCLSLQQQVIRQILSRRFVLVLVIRVGESQPQSQPLVPGLNRIQRVDPILSLCRVDFIERVRAIRLDYNPGEREIDTIAAICQRLDGLPLAIELAAARMSHLTADALLRALERLLPVLTTGRRDAQPRHRTMRDAIAWSVDLLPETTREWFVRLGAFPGSFPLNAAVQ